MTEPRRQPHCVPGSPTRLEKARKIEVVLSRRRALTGARWLEIGAGAGDHGGSLCRDGGAHW
jgi:hypothetical protein